MKARYKYKDKIYETEKELHDAHEQINCIGYETITEDREVLKDKGEFVIDSKTKEKKWQKKMKKVKVKVKVGNMFIYEDFDANQIKENRINILKAEKKQISKWYKNHDYYFHKVLSGEWEETDKRYTDYLKERPLKASRLDEINQELDNLQ